MKTYLLNVPNELKKISQKLDAQTILCSKTWEAFNDENSKQVFIFLKDGNLKISNNGNVTNSSWQYIPDNNSIIISVGEQSTMFRPAFIEGVVFALQKDGTDECLFLIGEKEKNICPNRSFAELNAYFAKRLEESPESVAAKQFDQRQKEQEKQKQERERIESIVVKHQDEIDALAKRKKKKTATGSIISGALIVFATVFLVLFRKIEILGDVLLVIDVMASIIVVSLILQNMTAKEDAEKEVISKYNQ